MFVNKFELFLKKLYINTFRIHHLLCLQMGLGYGVFCLNFFLSFRHIRRDMRQIFSWLLCTPNVRQQDKCVSFAEYETEFCVCHAKAHHFVSLIFCLCMCYQVRAMMMSDPLCLLIMLNHNKNECVALKKSFPCSLFL